MLLDAAFGDASLAVRDGYIEGRRSMLVGAEVDWNGGEGPCELFVDLQFGDIDVELE